MRGVRGSKVLLAIGGLTAGLLLSEGLLGWWKPQVSRQPSLWRFDDRLGWHHVPGASGWMRRPEFEVEMSINAAGLRDREYPLDRPSGGWRLLLFGDSFVEGWGVPAQDVVSSRLEARLKTEAAATPVEAINFGVAGYGTDQELLLFEQSGKRYRPDQVLLFFYANDLINNASDRGIGSERGYKPYFRVDPRGRLRLRGVPVKRSRFWDGSSAWPWEHRLDKYLKERLHVYAALRKAWSGAGVPEGSRQRFYEVLYGVEDDPTAERYWRLTGEILRAFRESASRAGAELILVYAPAIVQVEQENWRMKRDLFGLIGEFDLDKPNRRLAVEAARDGVPLLDLTPSFRKHTGHRRLYYEESHWTPEGHALAARLVADYLLRRRGQEASP
ncbi:MAG: SGNH/GDSL hydrolase family protein [Gemmatimonadaceae bacterium]|nr:SGNH/GDSL hydrolase family protein [Gemmatimonadaceae bacterium]